MFPNFGWSTGKSAGMPLDVNVNWDNGLVADGVHPFGVNRHLPARESHCVSPLSYSEGIRVHKRSSAYSSDARMSSSDGTLAIYFEMR